MKSIGGYFGIELNKGKEYHKNAIKLNTGRNCFEYILKAKRYKKIYIPYYTCEVILEPIQKLELSYEFYSIDEQLNPIFYKDLKEDEAFLYTNYYGLKQDIVVQLAKRFGEKLIVDNAQAFFAKPLKKIDTFYSARKFFGVADGAYLYTDTVLKNDFPQTYSFKRMSHLLRRIDCSAEDAFENFKKNDDALINKPITKMSKLTNALLSSIDYKRIKDIRRRNYMFFEKHLSENNLFSQNLSEEVPMIFPFRTQNEAIRMKLIKNKIFVATYWPNVIEWCNENQIEYKLAKQIIPLPIDQRYNESDMLRITELLYA